MPFIQHDEFSSAKTCNHPEHDPPGFIVLRPGTHIWQCPGCRESRTIIQPSRCVRFDNAVLELMRAAIEEVEAG